MAGQYGVRSFQRERRRIDVPAVLAFGIPPAGEGRHALFRRARPASATGTARDRADAHVAGVDVPAVLAFGTSAAGEVGHAPLKRGRDASGKPLGLGMQWNEATIAAVGGTHQKLSPVTIH